MKWSALWKVLKVIAEHAPEIIAAVSDLKKEKKDAGNKS
jgi:hypothetical protein